MWTGHMSGGSSVVILLKQGLPSHPTHMGDLATGFYSPGHGGRS